MPIPLFHESNTFTIYKNNGELKTIHFTGHKVGLYYKLYSILRKSHNFNMPSVTVRDITGRVLSNGNFLDIYFELIDVLKAEHKYSIMTTNSVGEDLYHFRDEPEGVLQQLKHLRDTYTKNGDPRRFEYHTVVRRDDSSFIRNKLDYLIIEYQKIADAENSEKAGETDCIGETGEMGLGVYLEFDEVVNDMREQIKSGTDKEKIEAKAVLSYIATKIALKQ
ncbi:hypothetical protein EJP02_476 [Escherichia phage EJP2]|nr:hypothetical protein EJP02_476 [Escherichia phage EJP2]